MGLEVAIPGMPLESGASYECGFIKINLFMPLSYTRGIRGIATSRPVRLTPGACDELSEPQQCFVAPVR